MKILINFIFGCLCAASALKSPSHEVPHKGESVQVPQRGFTSDFGPNEFVWISNDDKRSIRLQVYKVNKDNAVLNVGGFYLKGVEDIKSILDMNKIKCNETTQYDGSVKIIQCHFDKSHMPLMNYLLLYYLRNVIEGLNEEIIKSLLSKATDKINAIFEGDFVAGKAFSETNVRQKTLTPEEKLKEIQEKQKIDAERARAYKDKKYEQRISNPEMFVKGWVNNQGQRERFSYDDFMKKPDSFVLTRNFAASVREKRGEGKTPHRGFRAKPMSVGALEPELLG